MDEPGESTSQASAQDEDNVEIVYVPAKRKRSPLRRIGCLALILVWLVVMLIPLVFIALAVQGNITIAHGGDVPDKGTHPRFQVQLISEIDFRGLHFTRSTIHREDENNLCVQTDVSYWLWQGDGEPATYCDCYKRDSEESDWNLINTTLTTCE